MRKSIEYLVEEGPDKGKLFILTRMSAFCADKWARHLVKALAEVGENISPSEINLGIGALAGFRPSLIAHLKEEDADHIYEDLLKCCQIKRDICNPLVEPTKILEADIQDPMTLSKLRNKVFELHVDFLKAAASQIFPLVAAITQGKDILSAEKK
ncbi:hypothetical protein FAI41_04470 [Acetobacteraceae bacterium]|nr:hypothetical protein FAI41_04470 [Acetobacteraceae bacterium]